MFEELAQDVYEDEQNRYCVVGDIVGSDLNSDAARIIGINELMRPGEVVLRIEEAVARFFRKKELDQRLDLGYGETRYNISPVTISRFNGDYYIAGIPLSQCEIKAGGICDGVNGSKSAVRFSCIYRHGIGQNEIDEEFKSIMAKRKRRFKSKKAREFLQEILED